MYSHELRTCHFFKNKSLLLHSIFGLVAGISIAMIIYPVMHFTPGGGSRISNDDVRMYTRPVAVQQPCCGAATPGLYAVHTAGNTTAVFTTQPIYNSTLQQLMDKSTESLTRFE